MPRQSGLAEAADIICGVSLQFARKYLLLMRTERKAVVYLVLVALLSLYADTFPFSENFYFAKKGNIMNQYGVKLGWFWTCFVLCPFVWYTSLAHRKSTEETIKDLARMLVATACWYFSTSGFVVLEQRTGYCNGALSSARASCRLNGGKWVPGFDISGHCFLLIYSSLIICEEALAFRHLPSTPRRKTADRNNFRFMPIIKLFFMFAFALQLLWDFELLISVLYYHTLQQKLLGAAIAVACWFFTYRLWYPSKVPPSMPVNQRF